MVTEVVVVVAVVTEMVVVVAAVTFMVYKNISNKVIVMCNKFFKHVSVYPSNNIYKST